MRRPGCLRCKVIVTMPDGKEVPSHFTVNLSKKHDSIPLEKAVAEQLDKFRQAICARFAGPCKVRITLPCQLAQECGP